MHRCEGSLNAIEQSQARSCRYRVKVDGARAVVGSESNEAVVAEVGVQLLRLVRVARTQRQLEGRSDRDDVMGEDRPVVRLLVVEVVEPGPVHRQTRVAEQGRDVAEPAIVEWLRAVEGVLHRRIGVSSKRILLTTLDFFVNNSVLRSCPARNFDIDPVGLSC